MNLFRQATLFFILFFTLVAASAPLSDSLPIEGNYSQAGHSVSNFKLERFLLQHDTSMDYTDRSLGYRWSGHSVGALLWCVNIGVTAYEIKQIYDAIQNQSISIDSTGLKMPFSNNLYKFIIPITIGTEVASFVQTRLYDRADYLLYKGALAYNASLAKKYSQDLDLHIEKLDFGGYKQAGLYLTEPVLYGVLLEQPASRARSVWSWVFKELGIQVGSWAGMYLGLALISYLQETMGDTMFAIDKKAQRFNLTMGLSLTAFSIASAIASSVIRNKGIEKYNESLPKRNPPAAPAAPEPQNIIEGKSAAAPDSVKTGITEVPKKALTDTTTAKEDSVEWKAR
jgi:hypothetical protein